MDTQTSEPCSKLGLTNAVYGSFKDLGSLHSEECHLMNPNIFEQNFMTYSIICSLKFKFLVKVILRSLIDDTELSLMLFIKIYL